VITLDFHPYCLAIPEMSDSEFQELKGDISGSGLLEPIVMFEGKILDGRHRYKACLQLGIEPWFKDYDGPDSALDYVISLNLRRRHLSESQRAMAMANLCGLLRGRPKQAEAIDGEFEEINVPRGTFMTRAEAADKAGVGDRTMARAMKVDRSGATELVDAVKRGDITVNTAAQVIDALPDKADQAKVVEQAKAEPKTIVAKAKAEAQKPKPKAFITLTDWKGRGLYEVECLDSNLTFNKQENDSIEWADWSWNPVTGCKHECSYCYARDIANRFFADTYGFEPTIHPERLRAPYNSKLPKDVDTNIARRNVFANSMSDLYGRWVPQEWIDAVFKAMIDNPQWNFLTLTKFPKRAAELVYPENVWIGTSVDFQARVKTAEEAFSKIECGVRWLSIEPLLEPLTFTKPELFDWVVIGGASASSQTPAWTPPADWMIRVASQFLDHGAKIYLKTNGRPREFPGVITPETADEAFRYLKA
jgi:protein gp37